jgi:hypothetical protein
MPILALFHLVFISRMPYDYYISGTLCRQITKESLMKTKPMPNITKDTPP